MRRFFKLILIPLVMGALAGLLLIHMVPTVRACECWGDETWVVDAVEVEGAPVPWPDQGSIHPDQAQLWGDGFLVDIEYQP
jgi:hypothetical protein